MRTDLPKRLLAQQGRTIITNLDDHLPSIRHSTPPIVTNIGDLFDALAVDWEEGSTTNRQILAGEGGQFVRVPEGRFHHPMYRKHVADIPIDSGPYSMKGFIRFEIQAMFKGLFKIFQDPELVWFSAELTLKGFELSQSGLLDFDMSHPDIKRCAFFNPPAQSIVADLTLTHTPLRLRP